MMNTRDKGQGSVTRTKNGKFKGTISLGEENGKRKRISRTFDTLEEVYKFFDDVSNKNTLFYSPTTIAEYWEHYLKIKSGSYRASTLAGCKYFYDKHVRNSVLNKTKFNQLDAPFINRFFFRLESKGYAEATLTRWRKNVKSILDMAVFEGYLEKNPMRSERAVKKFSGRPPRPITPFTKAQVRKLLNPENLSLLSPMMQLYFLLAFLTGARPQELLALEKADIREDATVSFNKSLGFKGKLQDMMKTPYSVRVVPVMTTRYEQMIPLMQQLPRRLFASEKSRYGYVSRDHVGYVFRKYILKILGLTNHRLYDSRHTFATLLITVDHVDIKTASKLLGHGQVETTLKYYTHVDLTTTRHDLLRL